MATDSKYTPRPRISQVKTQISFHKDSIKNPDYADGQPLPTRWQVKPTHRMETPSGRITELHITDAKVVKTLVDFGWSVLEVLS